MIICKVYYDWDQHRESFVLVCLKNVEEIVILKEAHGSVSHLQMDASNASNNSFEELWNQVVNFINFAYLEDFLQFCQEQSFFDAIGERPVLKETFKQGNGEGSIFGQKEHGASQ